MSISWHKVWRDLTHHKARTGLAVLSTAVGILALGLVFGLSNVLNSRMLASHRASIPAHITFWGGPFDPETVAAIRRHPGVAEAEGEIAASFRWRLAGEREWRDGDLIARDDYANQRMNLLALEEGEWPAQHGLSVERQSAGYYSVAIGSTILVEFGQHQRPVPVVGVVRAPVVDPPQWGGDAMFFADPAAVAGFADHPFGEDFDVLHVRLASFSPDGASALAQEIQDRLERAGLHVGGHRITDPNEHWVQGIVDAVTIILLVLGLLSLGLSAFLIVNTMNAVMVQQVRQVGVMKAIGATGPRVARIYLATAAIYGLLALLVAVPLGAAGAHLLGGWLLGTFNIAAGPLRLVPLAVGTQLAMGLAVPLLAALPPVVGGTRITVREAIGSHGIKGRFGHGSLDRLVGRVRFLPRPVTLSLRNAFRRKTRVALTLVTLVFGGLMFTMVLSTARAFSQTIAHNLFLGEELGVELERPYRADRLVEIAAEVPEVITAEVFDGDEAVLVTPSGETHPVDLIGVPSGSTLFNPNIVAGRSLLPGEAYGVVANVQLAQEEGIRVGDRMTLEIAGEDSQWTVVGLYLSVDSTRDVFYVPRDSLGRETGRLGYGGQVRVRAGAPDQASQERVARALADAYTRHRIEVDDTWSTSQQLAESEASFGMLTNVLLIMVILAAAVGAIGLASTMSMNVVERRREIGVMRALGASSRVVAGMCVGEGMLMGGLSWLLAVPLSVPGSHLLGHLVGLALLEVPLEFAYATGGMGLWLLIVLGLSALASLLPALRATQISVRQSLAYE